MFRDGLGERRHITNPSGTDQMEVLCLRGELTSVPSFEFALRERVSHLAQFRHAYYARVRSVERLNDASATLALASDHADGVRLSAILEAADRGSITLDINAALCLVRQLVPAVGMLHEAAPQISHGAIAPERVIITPNARVVLPEYVLGAALEQLRYSQERYWRDLRVATARVGGVPRFDHRSDVTSVGVVALSVIAGRALRDDEFPAKLPEVLGSAWAISARGGLEPLPAGLRGWLARTLQLDARNSFSTIAEAQSELDRVLGDSDYLAAPAALEAVLTQYREIAGPSEPVAAPVAAPLPQAVNETRAAVASTFAAAAAVQSTASNPMVGANSTPPPQVASVATATTTTPAPTLSSAGATAARPIVPQPPKSAPAAPVMSSAATASTLTPAPQITVLGDTVAPSRPTPPVKAPVERSSHEPVVIETAKQPEPAIEEVDEIEDDTPAPTRHWKMLAGAAVVVLAVISGGAFAARQLGGGATRADLGTIAVTTNPAGAQLLVDGVLRGTTPVTLNVAPGAHTLVIRNDGSEPRTIPVNVTAGAQVSQFLDLPKNAPAGGQLQVRTEPAGAQVSVDGVGRGASPVTISDLPPGDHTVVVEGDLGKVEQSVSVTAGTLASVLVPLSAPKGAPVSGWISVAAPADIQIYENGKLLGSSEMDRLMVSTGSHQLELVNESLGYRATKTVQVTPGKVSSIKIEFPKGTIALNAIPWADVWIDGEKVGETPLGNIPVSLGSHEVVFRNPDLGEQKHTVVVSLTAPARLSVDLRKK